MHDSEIITGADGGKPGFHHTEHAALSVVVMVIVPQNINWSCVFYFLPKKSFVLL